MTGSNEPVHLAEPILTPQPSDAEKVTLLLQVLDLIPDFFYVQDSQLRLRYVNASVEKFWSKNRAELIGKRVSDFTEHKEAGESIERIGGLIMERGVPMITDRVPYIRESGVAGFMRRVDIPFTNTASGEKMLIGMARDITDELELQQTKEASAALRRELEIARTIQRSLQPNMQHAQKTGGAVVDLAAFCEPAAFAGGDFFDWFTAADGRIILCLGDVTGHGVGPALLAAECRAYSRVLLHQLPLGEAMQRLNELMLADLEEGRFVTFVAVAIDQQSRVAEVSSAGQGPLLLRRADGVITELEVQHAPLGIGPLGAVPPSRMVLGAGDAIVLVSDGVYEATSATEKGRFGTARMLESLSNSAGQTAAATVSQLIAAVTGFAAGQAAEDDVTVLVARGV